MSNRDRHRVTTLLLRAARRRLREEEVRRIPLVPTAAGGEKRLSIEDIRELATRHGHVLAAADPEAVSVEGLVDPAATLVASSEICGLLADLTNVRFQAPYRRANRFTDRFALWFRRVVEKVARRILGMAGPPPIALDALTEGETMLLAALRAADPDRKIAFCEGRGKVRTIAGELVVPRNHQLILASSECVQLDSSWVYPVLLSLDADEIPPEAVRERWRSLEAMR